MTALNINENALQSQSQNQRILRYLRSGKCITSLEALELFDCSRLAARIADIKRLGWNVISGSAVKAGTKKRYAVYSLAESDWFTNQN